MTNARNSANFMAIQDWGKTGGRMLISANLGFLFTDLALPDRVRAARNAGFDAVEFHDLPKGTDLEVLRGALGDMPLLGLNTFMGPSMGRAARSRAEFADDFTSAAHAAQALGAHAIHVVAGMDGDQATYLHNLEHALARTPCRIVIEPISAAGYFLSGFAQADAILDHVGDPNLRIMADWFHLRAAHSESHALDILTRLWPRIGHVQLARAGDRGAPCPMTDPEIARLLPHLHALHCAAIGLEYRPDIAPTRSFADTIAALRA
ncbi:TIM barrel protein [Roseinatronobacter sp.]|uniref:TIM barrel protein n=1 Tax=Roseinatronobacter sp. TaxID=1945755 RepID=UPI0025DF03CB|nr:TIM barrel protein [Roseibaca sp.]